MVATELITAALNEGNIGEETTKGTVTNGSNVNTIRYYGLKSIDLPKIQKILQNAVNALQRMDFATNSTVDKFVTEVFASDELANMLIHLSQLPVFEKDFSLSFKNDLELLRLLKRLKYYNNLPIRQNLRLIQQLLERYNVVNKQYNKLYCDLVQKPKELASTRFKDFLKQTSNMKNISIYTQNLKDLESIDPHAVSPTSIYRQCDGLTLATKDSLTIEAVMRTTLTTTVKITKNVLDPSNRNLINVYEPLGRCIAIIDDKVFEHYKEELQRYFDYHGIELTTLIHSGNEVHKNIENVEKILVELKTYKVSRNEPLLIIGGGVIADVGGFATALYHRNTPYVMLCTSIVTGIDAGPSPRRCCDGFGFKNIYGAFHPPILTLTDRSFYKSLHEGWVRHGIAEIIKMGIIKDKILFELVEKAGPRLIRTKFGTEGDIDFEFETLCDIIIGKAMEGYVRCEYGNMWETHQFRPHAYGHTWSPGYELPSGLLHGHAVSTCMGFGAYLAKMEGFITENECTRILKLLSNMELALWHDIMDNHDLLASITNKVSHKRGGNLCAPLPKPLGQTGYINELSRDKLVQTLNEYKKICISYPRNGHGIDVHCRDVGLDDPSLISQDALKDLEKK